MTFQEYFEQNIYQDQGEYESQKDYEESTGIDYNKAEDGLYPRIPDKETWD